MLPAGSFLDQLVDRFRHRWETDRQYRAAASGVLGLVVLIALCSCAGIVSSVTTRVLATGGFGSNSSVGPLNSSGAPVIQGAALFPTETIAAWQAGVVPNGPPIPNSGTPVPTPTHPPTPTAAPSPTQGPGGGGGGGGGGIPTTCNGSLKEGPVYDSWSLAGPGCPLQVGQKPTLTIHAPLHPNASLNILIAYCASNCTVVYTQYSLDANGYFFGPAGAQLPDAVPAAAAHSNTPVSGMINIGGGPTLSINFAPVQ